MLYKEAKKQGLFDYFLSGTYNIYQGCWKGLCGISKGDIFLVSFSLHTLYHYFCLRVKGGGAKAWEMWEFAYRDGVVSLGDFETFSTFGWWLQEKEICVYLGCADTVCCSVYVWGRENNGVCILCLVIYHESN